MRRAAKVDGNHGAVVAALRKAGCSVQSLAQVGKGCPDVVVGIPSGERLVNLLFEIKDGSLPPSARRLTPAEAEWHAKWRGQVAIVESEAQALALVDEVRAWGAAP